MIKNEENKKGNVASDYNNSNEFSSTSPTSLQKKFRKDAKGNLILKKKFPIKKTKHHAYLVDSISPDKQVANIIDIESYKKGSNIPRVLYYILIFKISLNWE